MLFIFVLLTSKKLKIMKYLLLLCFIISVSSCDTFKSDYWIVRIRSYPAYGGFIYYDGSVDKYGGTTDIRIDNAGSGYTSSEITTLDGQISEWVTQCLKFRKKGEPVYLITPDGIKTKIK